jgi:DUF4097 and DUF4098 domain-containing protein YvlB
MDRRRASALFGTVLGILSTLLFLACLGRAESEELREEFHQSYPLTATGRFELSNINGSVTITGWDNNEVRVDAVKHAWESEGIRECKIAVDSHPDSIRIETHYPEHHWWFGGNNLATVDYTIKVPRRVEVDKISLVNGSLTISSVAGRVRGSSVNGSVRATELGGSADLSTVNSLLEVSSANVGNDLRLHSVNGRVVLTIPSNAEGEIRASTVNGHIENDFGLAVNRHQYVGSDLKAQLGSGFARIELNTVNGGIELRHANDGKPLSKPRNPEPEHGEEPI